MARERRKRIPAQFIPQSQYGHYANIIHIFSQFVKQISRQKKSIKLK